MNRRTHQAQGVVAQVNSAGPFNGASDDLSPLVSTVLAETRQSLESARADLHAVSSSLERSVAQAGEGLDRASNSTAALLAQSECLLADARPIIQDGARISHAAANVAGRYEQKLTRPSQWGRAKWVLHIPSPVSFRSLPIQQPTQQILFTPQGILKNFTL